MSNVLNEDDQHRMELAIYKIRDYLYDLEYYVDHGYNLSDELIKGIKDLISATSDVRKELCGE